MSGRGWIAGALSLGAVVSPGCGSFTRRQESPPHATAALLDSGPTPKITPRQKSDIQFALGRSAEESDQLDQAAGAYRSVLANDAKRGDAEHRLAVVLDRQGKTTEADEHFRRALKLDSKNPEILCDRGYSYHLRGRSAEAERALRSALTWQPDHARSHTNLGLVLADRGQNDAALAEFARAGTDPADARANLGLVLALGGHLEASRDQYAQASVAKPKSPLAQAGQKGVASALKARTQSGIGSTAGGPALASAPKTSSGTVDPAVQTTSASITR